MTETDEVTYKKIVSKGPLPFYYLRVKLEFEVGFDQGLSETQLKAIIIHILKEVYGEVGCSITVDILRFDPSDFTAILRVTQKNLIKLWSSLTLCSKWGGATFVFRVLQASPHLMALAVNSRELDL